LIRAGRISAGAGRPGAGSVAADRVRVLFRGEAPTELIVRRGDVKSWIWDDDPDRPWMVLSSEHRTIKLPDGLEFFA
jgi:hypothetical protein